jgi:peptidoglycan L-alanyl-D-glutamate endopeptidase CwlK
MEYSIDGLMRLIGRGNGDNNNPSDTATSPPPVQPVEIPEDRGMAGLLPLAREKFLTLSDRMERRGLPIRLNEGFRTRERQAWIYAQGRTRPGPIVTKAAPGTSRHETGRAFDIVMKGKEPYNPLGLSIAGQVGQELGLVWGGAWKFTDLPHFELPPGA